MSIEGIVLEHFSALPKAYIDSTTPSRLCHTAFHSLLSDDNKQYYSTTTAHRKRFIALIKEKNC